MALSKLTRPILCAAAERPAIAEAIAAGRRGAVFEAPVGFGKTTAIAAAVEHASGEVVWWRPDPGDASEAAFAGSLSDIARCIGARGGATIDAALASLPDGSEVVVEDLDRIPEGAPARLAFARAIEADAGRLRFWVSSESALVEFKAVTSGGALQPVRLELLALRRDELAAVAEARGVLGVPAEVLRRAGVCAQGHVTTFALLLDELRHGGRLPDPEASGEPTLPWALERWLERRSDDERELLIDWSPCPRLDAGLARGLSTARPESSATSGLALLETLADAALLVTRDRALAGVYRFHPLLRRALLERGRARGASAWSSQLRRAADALAENGQRFAAERCREAAEIA